MDNLTAEIRKLFEIIAERKVLLLYPQYVNTFALNYVLHNYLLQNKTSHNLKLDSCGWVPVPEEVKDALQQSGQPYDLILFFTSAAKWKKTDSELKQILNTYRTFKQYDKTEPNWAALETEAGKVERHQTPIGEHGALYSEFIYRYIFFDRKCNVKYLHDSLNNLYGNGYGPPQMSKLASCLIAKGYRSLRLHAYDSEEEAISLIRRLLHEEFGLPFRLIHRNISEHPHHNAMANDVLDVYVKGSQQSWKELNLTNDANKKIAFEMPRNLNTEKRVINTELIALYEKDKMTSIIINDILLQFEKISRMIYQESSISNSLLSGIAHAFKADDNPFIDNNIISTLDPDEEFMKCLRDHQYYNKHDEHEIRKQLETQIKTRFETLCSNIPLSKDFDRKLITNGMTVLYLLTTYPDGVPIDCNVSNSKLTVEEWLSNHAGKTIAQTTLRKKWSDLLVIASNLEHIVRHGKLIEHPNKELLDLIDCTDLTEFEYFYSYEIFKS